MELHEYMESRGITRDSITAEQERTRDRIEAYKLAQIRRLKDLTQASVAQSMAFLKNVYPSSSVGSWVR